MERDICTRHPSNNIFLHCLSGVDQRIHTKNKSIHKKTTNSIRYCNCYCDHYFGTIQIMDLFDDQSSSSFGWK